MKPAGPVSAGAEVVFWDSVKDTGDADMLLAYLAEYPEGMFSNLARIKLKRFGERDQSGGKSHVISTAKQISRT